MIPTNVLSIVTRLAPQYGVDVRGCLTTLSVETRMIGLEPDGSPVILCESAQFYRRVPKDKRAEAVKAGLATPKWNRNGYADQRTFAWRHARLDRMAAIDENAAYESISMGIGQIMGWHAKDVGFSDARAMYVGFSGSLERQIEAMLRLFTVMGIVDAINGRDWKKVAATYNGAGYRRNDYDAKLANAYATIHVQLSSGQTEAPTDGSLIVGSKGERVRVIQQQLVDSGYPVVVDGSFGQATMAAIAAFQVHNALPSNGRYDTPTAEALRHAALPQVESLPKGARELTTRASARRTTRLGGMLSRVRVASHLATGGGVSFVGLLGTVNEKVSSANDTVQTTQDTWSKMADMFASHPLAFAAVVGLVLMLVVEGFLGKAEDENVDAVKAGAST